MDKLSHLNGYYIREADDHRLMAAILPLLALKRGKPVGEAAHGRLARGIHGLKTRAKTLVELADIAMFYVADRPLVLDAKATAALAEGGREILTHALPQLQHSPTWSAEHLENWARFYAEERSEKLGKIAQPIRAALCGSLTSPPIFEVMEALGKDEAIARIMDAVASP